MCEYPLLTALKKIYRIFYICCTVGFKELCCECTVKNKAPYQVRAVETRQSLKECFIAAITETGYGNTSISAVAERANSSVGAFQNHFGTKKAAIELFWNEYCATAITELKQIEQDYLQCENFDIHTFLMDVSARTARLQDENLGLNQAMNLHFIHDKEIHTKTLEIMEKTVETIFYVVNDNTGFTFSPMSARIAGQILITLNLNYTLGGARMLPANPFERHAAIASAAAANLLHDK